MYNLNLADILENSNKDVYLKMPAFGRYLKVDKAQFIFLLRMRPQEELYSYDDDISDDVIYVFEI